MRRFPLVTVMVLLVGAVLTGSLWTMHKAGREALREFQGSQSQLAIDTASALTGYLGSFDSDTRLMATMAQGARRQALDRAAQDEVILTAFQALSIVVPHYRTIALFGPGRPPVAAVDPTENREEIAPALMRESAALATDVSLQGGTALRGPLALAGGQRTFYAYAAALGNEEAVVITADAPMMLEFVSRNPSGHSLVVRDPSGALWLGCEQRQRCRLVGPGSERTALADLLARAGQGDEVTSPANLVGLGLPLRVLVGNTAPVRSPLGAWSVAIIGSAADINVRQRAFLWHLVLTSLGIAGAMLTVGVFLLRQHSKAAALRARVQAAEEMATLRERSDKILENVPVGILGLTRDGRPAMVNRYFNERIATLPASDGSGGLDPLHPFTTRLRTHLDRALATGRSQAVAYLETGPPTDPRHYDVRVVPLNRPADDVEALALVEDLSELYSLQRQLVRAEKLVTVGVLSAGIAHEVGTPLAVIRARAEHSLERRPDANVAEDLQAIIDQIDRISSTIRQVLEFSREQPLDLGPADARAVLGKALQLLDWRISGKKLAVTSESKDELPPIAADPQLLEQVMVNLLMNACDASASGGGIEVVLQRDSERSDCIVLSVTDHGIGIPAENLNAVFDPYFTTKKRGEGTGLGLAIVAQVVRSHRGEISLSSTVNVGTTVTLLWPIAEERAADA